MEERVMAPTDRARAGFGPISPRVALVLVAVGIATVVLYEGRSALGPFVVGLVLAYLLDMPIERMARGGPPRWLSLLIVYAIVFASVVEALILAVRPLADELAAFIREF